MSKNMQDIVQDDVHALLALARTHAEQYMKDIDNRPVYPGDEERTRLQLFDQPLPDAPTDGKSILDALHTIGSPATVAQTGGRYFGFVNGGILPTALAAKWLVDVWDQNPALYVMSPTTAQLEHTCEGWLTTLFGLPSGTALGLVGGSSSSIFCGLAAGRNELLRRLGWDVNAKGLFGAPQIRVLVGEQAHAAVFKALALLGLGKERVETIPADDQGRMRSDQLPDLDEQCLVITQAGNVNSGAFDPLQEICAKTSAANAWVHVDGAFGLWAGASQRKYHLYRGAEAADSWSADAHKTLNAPYDCGIILCRHRDALVSAMQAAASYIQWSDDRDNMLYTPDMSRRARAVELWATLKSLGKTGIETLVDQLCDRAQQLAAGLEAADFQVVNDVVFNQVLIACANPDATQSTLRHLQQGGTCWCGGALWRGRPVIRLSVCSWKTTEDDVAQTVSAFVAARRKAEDETEQDT